ncbi:hypothetical protein [Pseudomonas sp. D(2018)]|uniref:hypothetical protein n=1 Tax=Pseudomonas sp. D(2018) TaxID=2502238 RepID=UPI0010F56990|nr:hypothetical protein [Pseudomonas sp. D(2018)]
MSEVEDVLGEYELWLLRDCLSLLDAKLAELSTQIEIAGHPEVDGLADKAEYYAGLGFVAMQRYLTSIQSRSAFQGDSLRFGASYGGGVFVVEVINAAANYWKHEDEWGLLNIVRRDTSALKYRSRTTVEALEKITPWDAYTCSNIVAALNSDGEVRMLPLLGYLEGWRLALMGGG